MVLQAGRVVAIELLLERGIEESEEALRLSRRHGQRRVYFRDERFPAETHRGLHLGTITK